METIITMTALATAIAALMKASLSTYLGWAKKSSVKKDKDIIVKVKDGYSIKLDLEDTSAEELSSLVTLFLKES